MVALQEFVQQLTKMQWSDYVDIAVVAVLIYKLMPLIRTPNTMRIARAVVANPKLILADDPTGNLDSRNGAEVMTLLTELNREGTTIVMVTHSQKDAAVAQRVVNLFDGQIVSDVKNEL